MRTTDEHIRAVYKIIRENLAFWGGSQFPGFLELVAETVGKRAPSPQGLPWLVLPVFTCEALNGSVEWACHVAAALELGRIAAGCLDEWQDRDTDGALWQSVGPEQTVNVANGLVALSFLTLDRLADTGMPPAQVQPLQREFHLTLLRMTQGQYAELSGGVGLEDYETMAGAKSGTLFRLACYGGALAAGASSEVAESYGEFGYGLGALVQLWNDLEGLAGWRGKRDVALGRGLPNVAARELAGEAGLGDPARASQLYSLARIEILHRRAAEALRRCPAAGQLEQFLDTYSARSAIDRATGGGARADEGDER